MMAQMLHVRRLEEPPKQEQMMTAEGNGGASSPRSVSSEEQHWEVIGPDSPSQDAHLIARAGELHRYCLHVQPAARA